ncbi:hypothetical protein JCM11251_007205 [Rhodosporidiobolus azoricus]
MGAYETVEQVFGWLGTILWCIQLVPQVWLNYKRQSTHGLSSFLPVCWMMSGAALGIYAIAEDFTVSLIVQPHCYGALCALIFCQILHYQRKWKWYAAYLGAFSAYAVVCAGFEVGMVYACRTLQDRHNHGLTMFFGILSAVMLGGGFIPQYYEIYRLKEVIGVSYLFLFMDSLGAVFSIISLAFRKGEPIDVIALVGYIIIIVAEVALGLLAFFLNPRARARRATIAEEEETQSQISSRTDTLCTVSEPETTPYAATEADAEKQVLPQALPPKKERELVGRETST